MSWFSMLLIAVTFWLFAEAWLTFRRGYAWMRNPKDGGRVTRFTRAEHPTVFWLNVLVPPALILVALAYMLVRDFSN